MQRQRGSARSQWDAPSSMTSSEHTQRLTVDKSFVGIVAKASSDEGLEGG